VFRGLFVMEHLLCTELKAPQGIPPLEEPKAGDPPRTTRQRHEQSHSPPTCAVCHKQIDGIGFGFGNFDAIGQWRDTENGVPVDARGELVGAGDADGPFSGVAELAQRLAGSARVGECVTNQWFRYAFGRVESAGDRCARRSIQDELVDAKGDMKALLLAIVKSDAFRFRPPTAP
jgi:hypothetical protein